MSLTPEEALEVSHMRLAIVKNMQEDKPAEHGIDREKLAELLDKVRVDRTIGAAGSGSKGKKAVPAIPMDLDAFMSKPIKE